MAEENINTKADISSMNYPSIREEFANDSSRHNLNYNDLVQSTLDNDGELPSAEYDALYDKYMGKKEEFINSDKKSKALLVKNINDNANTIGLYKTFRQDLASAYNSGTLMKGWIKTPQGRSVMSLLNNEPRLIEKKCPENVNCPDKGELGIILPDYGAVRQAKDYNQQIYDKYNHFNFEDYHEVDKRSFSINEAVIEGNGRNWFKISSLKNMIRLRDDATKNVLTEMGNNYLNQSAKTNPAENVSFNREAAGRQIGSNVIDKAANFESLIYDPMISGRTFYDDMIDRAMGHSYDDLGIASMINEKNEDPQQLSPFTQKKDTSFDKETASKKIKKTTNEASQALRINTSDGINREEASLIVNELVGDPKYAKVLRAELIDYYTNYLEKQWNTGIANRPNPTGIKTPKENIAKQNVDRTLDPDEFA
jgi:hypothetical protein